MRLTVSLKEATVEEEKCYIVTTRRWFENKFSRKYAKAEAELVQKCLSWFNFVD